MDRRRAAGALIALAACLATSHAAPTATSNHTALDLYDEVSEGCYYNFQHYGEGDRIMTNEPCLNCTCHNRMLMCYLRVCPFTKAIGQDCTVEKRADQCCPIVTCPDVPVDLLTSTSTSSPAEYGGTGVGKIDKYGCTINGKYFPEGAKVPPTPNKPCEHCYCIRNMTTCVMQECTLHVDGCTPIYHKDVCCPVRYFCDHPEDEMLLLDDMTTTIRPTPGFLLTTIAPTEATEAPEKTTLPARRDCTEGDQLYPDGALIKTDKPCQHCYCMKGDIVCVVQECGTPMENEGKNCTSLPPREGQCCPDTYICEGDESSSEPSTALPFEEIVTTTIAPPRRVSVEGSGYRNEDEIPYTAAPTFEAELEGSGEEYLSEKPIKPTREGDKVDDFGPTGESEFISQTTSMKDDSEKATTEPDKGLNTVPSEEYESFKPMGQEPITEHTRRAEYETTPSVIAVNEQESSKITSPIEMSTSKYEVKETESSIIEEPTTARSDTTEQSSEPTIKESAPKEEPKATEPNPTTESDTGKPEDMTETSIGESPTATENSQSMEQSTDVEKETLTEKPQTSTKSSIVTVLPIEEVQATTLHIETDDETTQNTRRTMPPGEDSSKGIEEEKTESSLIEPTTERQKLGITEQAITEQNTIPTGADALESSEPTILEETTSKYELQPTASPSLVEQPTESTEGIIAEKTTALMDVGTTKAPITEENIPELDSATVKDNIPLITTESVSEEQRTTTSVLDAVTKTSLEDKMPVTVSPTTVFDEQQSTTESSLEPEVEKTTINPIMELSTFAHLHTLEPEVETSTEKVEIPETTTVNEADNEIPPPGRIPGEGDCLLEGVTYKNDSVVPSTNKCHTGCKCVSSIIKCDPIICSSPPEGMDNCQPRYDSPETCCPTYICDHGMETIPPQPQSHITGTDSPTSYPAVECTDDQCNVSEDKKESTVPSGTIDQAGASECDNEGCKLPVEVPTEGCTESKCELPQSPPKESQPHETMEVIQGTPVKEVIQSCDNPENCKETNIQAPCEGASCPTGVQGELCDEERGCVVEPEIPPPKTISELCGSDRECKPVSIPEPPCKGESCSNVNEGCSAGQCPSVSLPVQPGQQEEICSGGKSCEKPQEPVVCDGGKCLDKDLENKSGCTGDECMQQQPLLPTQETSSNVPREPSKGETTVSPMLEEVTTLKSETDTQTQEPIESDKPELPSQGVTEVSAEKEQKLPESSVTDTAGEGTTPPDRESELASTAIETMPQDKTEGYLLEKETERPDLPTKSQPTGEADEGLPTKLPVPEIETSQPTTLSETKQSEDFTNAPDVTVSEEDRTTALPESEKESEKPEEHDVPTAAVPSAVTEITTPSKSVSEEIITETSVIPESESQKPIPEDDKEIEQISTESPEPVHPEISTPALNTTPQPQVTESPIPQESASTIPAKESQGPEIDMQTPLETKGTEPPYSLVTEQAEETTPSIPEFVKITPETSVTAEEQGPETIKPYTPQQTTEAVAPIASDTEPSILNTSQEAFTEQAGDAEPEKAPTTEKQNVQPEQPEPSTTELFKDTQSVFGSPTTSVPEIIIKEQTTEKVEKETTATETSIMEEVEISSGKPTIIETVSPTKEIELETDEPEITSGKPGEEHNTPVTKAEPTSNEMTTEKTEQVSTKDQEEFVTQDVTKSPISIETLKPGDLSSDEQLSTHEPQKSSTESTINVEFETKQPDIKPTEEVKTETEMSTEPNEKGTSLESVTDIHMEYSHTKEPSTASTELTREPVTSAPIYTTQANPEPSVNEDKDLEKQQTEAVPPHLPEQPVETPRPELEEGQEVPTSRPIDQEEQSLQTTKPEQQEEPTQTMRPEVTQEESVPTSRPENEQEETAQTPTPEGAQIEHAQTTRPAGEQEEPTQTFKPDSGKVESSQTSSPETEQEILEQTSTPESDQEEPVQSPRPEGEQEESTQTSRPGVPGESAQTSRPESEPEGPTQTSRPESEHEEPAQTLRPEDEQEEPVQTSKPDLGQEGPAQTSRPEGEQEGSTETSRPESEHEEPAQTLRPENEQEEPVQTSKPDLGHEGPAQTSRPEGEQEGSTETSRPESEHEEPAQTLRPENEQEEPVQTSKPDLGHEDPAQTSRPEGEQEGSTQTSRPESEYEEPAQTLRPEEEHEEPVRTSKPDLGHEGPAQTSRPEGEQEGSTQTSRPESEYEEPAQTLGPEEEQEEPVRTSKPDHGQEGPAQTSRPESEQEEPAETSRPDIRQDEPAHTSKPEREQEESTQTSQPAFVTAPAQTSRPEIEEHEYAQTQKPEDEQDKPIQTSRPDIEQEENAQTSRPEIEQEVYAQTLKPEGEPDESDKTSRPGVGQEEPAQTSRPESGQEEPTQTSRPEIEQEIYAQTLKPEGEPDESDETSRPGVGQEEPAQTSRPESGQEEPTQTSRPEIEQEIYAQTLKPEGEPDESDKTSRPGVGQEEPAQTSRPESGQEEPTQTYRPEGEQETAEATSKPGSEQEEHVQPSTAKPELTPEEAAQTLRPEIDQSETTPYLVELEEHTHKMDVEPTMESSEEPTTLLIEPVATEQVPTESISSEKEKGTERPYDHKEEGFVPTEEPRITTVLQEEPEASSETPLVDKFGSEEDNKEALGTTPKQTAEEEISTYRPSTQSEKVDTEKPISADEITTQFGQDVTSKPISIPKETTAPEEEFIPVTSKATTPKVDEETPSQPPTAKPGEKPSDMPSSTTIPETSKPEEIPPVDEEFLPPGGYNQEPEPDYTDEDQAFGPGTCRYGGKVYVSAQQIPRDDPCDFCFCFRSDIICLQQSCPPPIHGCHEEPIQGFCCPRYECPVSMATTLNVTTTTTTTTTTLPPHFLPHAYKGAAQRKGCQIKGHTYQVGEVVRASSGPCLHCTCGGDGQMKCDPKACTPEPMLRQMIAAAVSAKRRR